MENFFKEYIYEKDGNVYLLNVGCDGGELFVGNREIMNGEYIFHPYINGIPLHEQLFEVANTWYNHMLYKAREKK